MRQDNKRMTRKPWIAGSLCLLIGLAGCTEETLLSGDGDGLTGMPIQVLADIAGVDAGASNGVTEGVYDHDSFESGEQIKIVKSLGGGTTANALYAYSGTAWSLVAGQTALTLEPGATYQGSYPSDYSAIQADQTTTANYKKSDRMETPATVYPQTGVLDFTGANAFSHKNAKLTLKFTLANSHVLEQSKPGAYAISVSGNGIITGGGSPETIQLYTSTYDKASRSIICSGILYPKGGSNTDISVSLKLDSVSYATTLSSPLAASTHYVRTLTIKNDVLVPVGDGTIADWKQFDDDIYNGSIMRSEKKGGTL